MMGFLMELPELEGRVQSNGSETDVTAMVAKAPMIVSQVRGGKKGLEIQESAYLQRRNKAVGLKAVGGLGKMKRKVRKGPAGSHIYSNLSICKRCSHLNLLTSKILKEKILSH
ncbi:MAG: hypothetical protein LBE64_09050 [Acinetobacter pittii]|nr:hypothetical protein [Acinetobacter pittii]